MRVRLDRDESWSHLNNISILSNYPELFRDEMWLKGVKVSLNVDKQAPTRFDKTCPLYYAYAIRLKRLGRLEKAGMVTPVNSLRWATPFVLVVTCDKTARICGDYKVTMNEA